MFNLDDLKIDPSTCGKDSSEWLVNIPLINQLPPQAIVAIVQQIDLERLPRREFEAISKIVDMEIDRRREAAQLNPEVER
jgi:hypothetical protein